MPDPLTAEHLAAIRARADRVHPAAQTALDRANLLSHAEAMALEVERLRAALLAAARSCRVCNASRRIWVDAYDSASGEMEPSHTVECPFCQEAWRALGEPQA